jgi:hypothetical protein
MTLEEYEKVLEEKRKALAALKIEERKVDLDKDLKSMQQLSRKGNDEIFIKLVSTLYFILIILHLMLTRMFTLELIVRGLRRISARKLLIRRRAPRRYFFSFT